MALCSIDPITQVDHSGTRVRMSEHGVLVVDGVFALRPELDYHWDLRIWVDIDRELSASRGVDRDAAREGTSQAEAIFRERYVPSEDLYIAEADPRSRAEVVVDNCWFDQPRLLSAGS